MHALETDHHFSNTCAVELTGGFCLMLLFLCASDSEADNGDNSFADVPAADKCMPMKKIIRKEIRKVNALHEAKLVKPPVQGFTRLRSPRREEVIFCKVNC